MNAINIFKACLWITGLCSISFFSGERIFGRLLEPHTMTLHSLLYVLGSTIALMAIVWYVKDEYDVKTSNRTLESLCCHTTLLGLSLRIITLCATNLTSWHYPDGAASFLSVLTQSEHILSTIGAIVGGIAMIYLTYIVQSKLIVSLKTLALNKNHL
ncbi:MAG: hypothetical protein ACTIM4_11705 [Marinomonas sp.]